MKIFKLAKYQGIGLIESLITFVIIAGSVVALVRFQINLAYHDTITQQQNDAILLATNKMETLRDFNVLYNQTSYISYQNIASGTSSTTGTNTTYTTTWTVTAYTNPTYKTLSVITSWTDRLGNTQSIRLFSDVAGIEPSFSATVM